MTVRLGILAGACALALAAPPAAPAVHWPAFGGDASHSGTQALEPGEGPIPLIWSRGGADAAVRTPVVITGGGGPDVQRVAYGTGNFHVHLQRLDTGAPVGAEEGVRVEDGAYTLDNAVFGSGDGAVGFADTSTTDKPGQLLVVHNDEGAVQVATFDVATGTRPAPDQPVPSTAGCATNSSPVLTPPDAGGGRILFFTITGACPAGPSLVRVPIEGDATRPGIVLGAATFAPVNDLVATASPSLVVLEDPGTGAPRFFVAVARTGGVAFHVADTPFGTAPPPAVTPPITAALGAGELPQTPVAPASAAGLVAGAEGSGTPKASAVYVAATSGSDTRVYRLVQDGRSATLRVAAGPVVLPEGSGTPSPAMALSEVMTPSGPSPGGRLVVAASAQLAVMDTTTLTITGFISDVPLAPGDGFARATPAVSGAYFFVSRDGDADSVPRRLVRRLDNPQVVAPGFDEAGQAGTGMAWGQPALSRGFAVFGSGPGSFAYRTTDITPPQVDIVSPPAGSSQAGTIEVAARAGDIRGIDSVVFKLESDAGSTRTLGRDTEPDAGSAYTTGAGAGRFTIPFQTASVRNGEYVLVAVATDTSGFTASAKRRIRISNEGGTVSPLRPGACANERTGTAGPDRMSGGASGDRLLGGLGNDQLSGGPGHDCLLGQEGDDGADGGSGDDLIDGGPGNDALTGATGADVLAGQNGRDRLSGGSGNDRLSGLGGNDSLRGGSGNDRLSGGAGRDVLRGDAGRDRLGGGRGNDLLVGGSSVNRLDGGPGNDRIKARNRYRDVIVCGRGRDRVDADRNDRVSPSCERVRRR